MGSMRLVARLVGSHPALPEATRPSHHANKGDDGILILPTENSCPISQKGHPDNLARDLRKVQPPQFPVILSQ